MEWVKLGDIAEIIGGYAFRSKEFQREGIPVLRISDLNHDSVLLSDSTVRIAERQIDEKYVVKKGDLLVGLSGSIGKMGIYQSEEIAYLNQRVAKIVPKSGTDKFYVNYLMESIVAKMRKDSIGGTVLNISPSTISEYDVFLPNLTEQSHITTRLNRIRDLIAKRREQIDVLDALVSSVFYELIFNESDEKMPLGELMSDFLAGKSLAGEKPSQFRVLKTSCVYSGYFDENEWKFLPVDYKPKEEHIVKSGDILVSRMNTEELVGASAYVDKDYDDLAIPDRLWILRTNEGVSPVFLWKFFQTDLYRGLISRIATGTSGSMKNISKKNFSQIQVPLPKLEVQNRFADYVTSIEAQKESLRASLSELETLFDALMQEAFSGHLNQS